VARRPLLQLSHISLGFGGQAVFQDLSLVVQPGDRVALVGRNGSGKSTLLRLMAGLVEADAGDVTVGPGGHVGYMDQDPDMSRFDTLGDFACADLAPNETYRVERASAGLKFDPRRAVASASGGERRRAALAKLMAQEPALMLLDEPTNHLDIDAIAWLEAELAQTKAAFVLISHDRAVLQALTRTTLWIDRGSVRRQDAPFSAFEAWRDKIWEDEDLSRHKLDRKIKAEAKWAVEGISARRKRNQGRVRALHALRSERAAQIKRHGTAAMALEAGQTSGRKVIKARGISKSFGDRAILHPFDLTILRGDRVALVGPNGVGKTTLLRILIGHDQPDTGRVVHGTNLQIAWFDQNRTQLDPSQSLWDSLTDADGLRVRGSTDQVMVRGRPRHVVGYLKDFLFDEAQARAPIHSLSGGEKAGLMLARIMARQSNLLVLDEPTNDLDIETLDLLQEVLDRFDGTVILVSHDRDFIDRVAATTILMQPGGRATVYAGGWSDMQRQRVQTTDAGRSEGAPPPQKKAAQTKARAQKSGLSFTERHRLDALPDHIDRLSAEIAVLETVLADLDLYASNPKKFRKVTEALATRQQELMRSEEDWLTLMEKAEEP